MTIRAEVIADTIDRNSRRITTMQLRYPRFIHSEFMTHRMFSRNASSSRAIPFKTQKAAIWKEPATFVSWGANQKGMQAGEELKGWRRWLAQFSWSLGLWVLWPVTWLMSLSGVHKQVINRMLEPWAHINVLVTATEWENFLELRLHKDAQPEMQALATAIKGCLDMSTPKKSQVHLPFLQPRDYRRGLTERELWMISAARCARLSYYTFGEIFTNWNKDLRLAGTLLDSKHMSPFEHQAMALESPVTNRNQWFGWRANFFGWESMRFKLEHGKDI